MRSYREYCAIAQALDVIGERWTLLIVRELLTRGPCRYSDLQYGLPGIATNLLARRLREMEQQGLLWKESAPRPVAATLFHLTERGEALKPLLESLADWGAPLVTRPIEAEEFRSHWLKLPIELYLRDRAPGRPPVTIEIRADAEPLLLETVSGAVRARPGNAALPDAIITGSGSQVLGLLLGVLDLQEAQRGGLTFEGSEEALARVQRPPQGAPLETKRRTRSRR